MKKTIIKNLIKIHLIKSRQWKAYKKIFKSKKMRFFILNLCSTFKLNLKILKLKEMEKSLIDKFNEFIFIDILNLVYKKVKSNQEQKEKIIKLTSHFLYLRVKIEVEENFAIKEKLEKESREIFNLIAIILMDISNDFNFYLQNILKVIGK
ncbi:hypothetical protein [Mesomycoplasma lagogenitalium]|uniref:Uncharacterized protein n=1 Tax=Mesomycoplasma lagogenitalium TaxID=171286 RepID=A0ABY8LSN7_9BACT|nr:hypothetical protein [Mesomycoplasma lagogenitalium]WGI36276.1 hypothetical protein QEG99_02235 [Mesomycoplasma lagogenitalium]